MYSGKTRMGRRKATHGQSLLQLVLVAYVSLLAATQKGDQKPMHTDVHMG